MSPDAFELSVRELPVEEVLPLRTRILRPHLPPGELARFEEDARASTVHFGVVDAGGAVRAVVSFVDRPCPLDPDEPAVQLRGMAVDAAWQGRGLGSRLLEGALPAVALRFVGRARLWCNARSRAVPFYERHGFEVHGEEFDIPGIGPHHVMSRPLPTLLA